MDAPEIGLYIDSDHLHSEDGITLLSGSQRINRDLYQDRKTLDPTGAIEARRQAPERMIIPPDEKWCFVCGWIRPIYLFDYDAGRADKHDPRCKECRKKYNHLRYQARKAGLTIAIALSTS